MFMSIEENKKSRVSEEFWRDPVWRLAVAVGERRGESTTAPPSCVLVQCALRTKVYDSSTLHITIICYLYSQGNFLSESEWTGERTQWCVEEWLVRSLEVCSLNWSGHTASWRGLNTNSTSRHTLPWPTAASTTASRGADWRWVACD